MACKPLPLEFGPLQEQILNRGQIFWDSPKQMSKQLVLAYQAPAIIYCGQRLSQGKTMKGAQLGAKCATMYNNPVAGGMLRYLVDTAGVELPRKLTLIRDGQDKHQGRRYSVMSDVDDSVTARSLWSDVRMT